MCVMLSWGGVVRHEQHILRPDTYDLYYISIYLIMLSSDSSTIFSFEISPLAISKPMAS
jgi:hypothetical protein